MTKERHCSSVHQQRNGERDAKVAHYVDASGVLWSRSAATHSWYLCRACSICAMTVLRSVLKTAKTNHVMDEGGKETGHLEGVCGAWQTGLSVASTADAAEHGRVGVGKAFLVNHAKALHIGPGKIQGHLFQLFFKLVLLLHQPLAFGLCRLLSIISTNRDSHKRRVFPMLLISLNPSSQTTALPASVICIPSFPSNDLIHTPLTQSIVCFSL